MQVLISSSLKPSFFLTVSPDTDWKPLVSTALGLPLDAFWLDATNRVQLRCLGGDDSFPIYVKCLTSISPLIINVRPSDTILQVKYKIYDYIGVDPFY